jgi:hypothetical protein
LSEVKVETLSRNDAVTSAAAAEPPTDFVAVGRLRCVVDRLVRLEDRRFSLPSAILPPAEDDDVVVVVDEEEEAEAAAAEEVFFGLVFPALKRSRFSRLVVFF